MEMTTRTLLTAIINGETLTKEHIAKATEMLASLDARNAKRSSADSKEKLAVSARKVAVFAVLTTEPQSREVIAEKANVTVGQATSALSAFVAEGSVIKTTVKDGKAKHMAYALAPQAEPIEVTE